MRLRTPSWPGKNKGNRDFSLGKDKLSLSLKTVLLICEDLKAFAAQDIGLKESGMGKVLKQNMIHHLLHRRYPVEL
jgi:hypothetical protein